MNILGKTYRYPSLIFRLVEKHTPDIVECAIVDAYGQCHYFIDKDAVFTTDISDPLIYPLPGVVAGEVKGVWEDPDGRLLATIDTERPLGLESSAERIEFTVLASKLEAY